MALNDETTQHPRLNSRAQSSGVYRSTLGRRVLWRCLPFGVIGAAMLSQLSGATSLEYTMLPLALLAIAVVTPFWLVLGTSYRLHDGTLTVTMAFRRKRIPLTELGEVTRASRRSIWAWSPGVDDFALGTRVIEIESRDRLLLISPQREDDFLAAISRRIA